MFYNADDENVFDMYSINQEPTRKELLAIEKENNLLEVELSNSCNVEAWQVGGLNNPTKIFDDGLDLDEVNKLKSERFDILEDLKDSRAVLKDKGAGLKKKIFAKKSIKFLQDELKRVREEEQKYWAEVFA